MANPRTMLSRVDFSTAVMIKRISDTRDNSNTWDYPERFNACCFVSACNPQLFYDYNEVNKRGEFRTSFDSSGRHCAERSGFSSPYMSPPYNSNSSAYHPPMPYVFKEVAAGRKVAPRQPSITSGRALEHALAPPSHLPPTATKVSPRRSLAYRIRTARRKARFVSRWRGAKLQVMYPQRLRIQRPVALVCLLPLRRRQELPHGSACGRRRRSAQEVGTRKVRWKPIRSWPCSQQRSNRWLTTAPCFARTMNTS